MNVKRIQAAALGVIGLAALSAAAGAASPESGAAAPKSQIWSPAQVEQQSLKPDLADPAGGKFFRAWVMGQEGLNAASLLVQIKAGQRAGAHVHSNSAHYCCVLKGTALLWVEGNIQRVNSGECYTVPATLLHDVGADSSEDLWFVETTTPVPTTLGFEATRQDEVKARTGEIDAAFKAVRTKGR